MRIGCPAEKPEVFIKGTQLLALRLQITMECYNLDFCRDLRTPFSQRVVPHRVDKPQLQQPLKLADSQHSAGPYCRR